MGENIFSIVEAKRERMGLVKQAREILDKADAEKRGLTAEEEERYNKIDKDIEAIGQRIEKEEKLREMEKTIENKSEPVAGKGDLLTTARDFRASDEYRNIFKRYLVSGISTLSSQEIRQLQADGVDPTLGGNMVAPQQFIAELIKGIDNAVFVRKYATIYQLTNAATLGVPTVDTDIDDAEWTTELATGTTEATMAFGKRALKPIPLAKRIKVSNKLLRVSAIDPETLVRQRMEYKFGVTLEKAYMIGVGTTAPLGIFTPSTDGIPTSRDVNCGMKDDENNLFISADGLIDVKYALKSAYWKKAVWVLHPYVVREIRKLKTGLGTYVWQPGLTATQPDTLLDSPMVISEYAPNSLTEDAYICVYGDLSYYWIVDALGFTIQRLVELYAENNETGFIGRYEGDGMPVLAEAFVRGKLSV